MNQEELCSPLTKGLQGDYKGSKYLAFCLTLIEYVRGWEAKLRLGRVSLHKTRRCYSHRCWPQSLFIKQPAPTLWTRRIICKVHFPPTAVLLLLLLGRVWLCFINDTCLLWLLVLSMSTLALQDCAAWITWVRRARRPLLSFNKLCSWERWIMAALVIPPRFI